MGNKGKGCKTSMGKTDKGNNTPQKLADDKTDRRTKKPGFTDEEICELLTHFKEKKDILLMKFNTITNAKNRKIWVEIASFVSQKSTVGLIRTYKEVQHKWKDLLARAKKDDSEMKNPGTGGGKKKPRGAYSDMVLEIYGNKSATFTGITGSVENGVKETSNVDEEEDEVDEDENEDDYIESVEIQSTIQDSSDNEIVFRTEVLSSSDKPTLQNQEDIFDVDIVASNNVMRERNVSKDVEKEVSIKEVMQNGMIEDVQKKIKQNDAQKEVASTLRKHLEKPYTKRKLSYMARGYNEDEDLKKKLMEADMQRIISETALIVKKKTLIDLKIQLVRNQLQNTPNQCETPHSQTPANKQPDNLSMYGAFSYMSQDERTYTSL